MPQRKYNQCKEKSKRKKCVYVIYSAKPKHLIQTGGNKQKVTGRIYENANIKVSQRRKIKSQKDSHVNHFRSKCI